MPAAGALWVVPSSGGEPRRLTWYPRNPFPRTWSPDGRTILFASARDGDANLRGITVPAAGGPETTLPVWPVRYASYSPDGKRLAVVGRTAFFNGVDRRFYRGGNRDPISLIDPLTGEGSVIRAGDVNLLFPMWVDHRIYFATDTLGSFNLAEHDLSTGRTRLLTHWRSYGITAASAGGGAIAFVRDGRIHLFDIATGTVSIPPIEVSPPRDEDAPKSVAATSYLQDLAPGPRGEKVAVEARGDVLIVDVATGESRDLTATPGSAERTPSISPDGKLVAYFSDASGEYALHVRAVDGSGEARVIALGRHPTYFHAPTWSPDSRRIAFSDQRLVLWVADVVSGAAEAVDSSRWIAQRQWQTSWSPDGRWLAYAKADPKGTRGIWLRDVEQRAGWMLSSGGSHDEWPVFDPSGRWLYFASSSNSGNAPARDVWSLLSDLMAQPFVSHRLMVATLRAGDVMPMLPYGAGPNPAAKTVTPGAMDPVGCSASHCAAGVPRLTRSSSCGWHRTDRWWSRRRSGPRPRRSTMPRAKCCWWTSRAPQRPVQLAAEVRSADVSGDGGSPAHAAWRRVEPDPDRRSTRHQDRDRPRQGDGAR